MPGARRRTKKKKIQCPQQPNDQCGRQTGKRSVIKQAMSNGCTRVPGTHREKRAIGNGHASVLGRSQLPLLMASSFRHVDSFSWGGKLTPSGGLIRRTGKSQVDKLHTDTPQAGKSQGSSSLHPKNPISSH